MNNGSLLKTICVRASNRYNVLIGRGLLNNLGMHLLTALNSPCKIVIITDSNVWPIYGQRVTESVAASGFDAVHYTVPAGESSKGINTCFQILNFLAEQHLTRSDAVIALGGGVVGDLAGFAASIYMRGIPYVQIPTTLLAMVDSSVGGKTAVDLPAGKNLVGAFYQPSLVICDLNTLDTLSGSVLNDGCAEVIKYGVLFDPDLFAHMAACGNNFDRDTVIARCIEWKRDIIENDEFDTGLRQKLNLGHTIGHAIEVLSDYTISHGQAVAAGMAIITKAGCASLYPQLSHVLEKFGLPITAGYSARQLYDAALLDKKRAGGTINLIIPAAIGNCEIIPTSIDALESFIEEGL